MAYSDKVKALVAEYAGLLRKQIANRGSSIFGEPMDATDPDTLLLVAYQAGKSKGYKDAVRAYGDIDDTEAGW